jgi:hypothetical protein
MLQGTRSWCAAEILNNKAGEKRTLQTAALFSFIGATPRTDWLPLAIEKDAKNFVRTGITLAESPHWKLKRQPFLLETNRPGIFAAGDVRSGSVRRVASAVGEGSMSVQFVHEFLKEMWMNRAIACQDGLDAAWIKVSSSGTETVSQKRQKKYLLGRIKRVKADLQPATRGNWRLAAKDFISTRRAGLEDYGHVEENFHAPALLALALVHAPSSRLGAECPGGF